MLGIGALFLLFVQLYSQRVASQSCETLGERLHHPITYLRHNRHFNKKEQELLLERSREHRELGQTTVALSSTSKKQ